MLEGLLTKIFDEKKDNFGYDYIDKQNYINLAYYLLGINLLNLLNYYYHKF